MQIVEIPLSGLVAHPANANVMPGELLGKLEAHIRRTGRYPPVIVRPLGQMHQVLDGHHRVEALRRVGRSSARCVVWDVDDREALVLLTTLNGLRGRDDPRKRAAIVADLARRAGLASLVEQLPEKLDELEHLMLLHRPPPARPPARLDDMPVPVHFFLLPGQRALLERELAALGGSREHALMRLVQLAKGANDEQPSNP